MTSLSVLSFPSTSQAAIGAKAAPGLPYVGTRIRDFDVWRQGYAGASVLVVVAGTTTAAEIFADPYLTTPIPNPVTLLTLTDDAGNTYGKWPTAVYAFQPYFLTVNDGNSTGIDRPPLYDVGGVDLSLGLLKSRRGQYGLSVQDFADLAIYAVAFGDVSEAAGATTTTATLQKAIGAAAAQGGGTVMLPSGFIPFTTLSLPEGVVLQGQGISSTTLSSLTAAAVITLGGDGAGLRALTLDGLNVVPNSIGVDGINIASPVFEHVVIKRFALGQRLKGLPGATWTDLSIVNCTTASNLRGDLDAAGTNQGTAISNLTWRGGTIGTNTTAGLVLECKDALVENILLEGVQFASNVGAALSIIGARNVRAANCGWASNTAVLNVQDGADIGQVAINTVEQVLIEGGRMVGGTATFNGTCQQVQIRDADLSNVSFNLSVPTNPILLRDCITDALVTFAGDTSKVLRQVSANTALVVGTTTDGNPLTAWKATLQPGETGLVEARVIARQRDGSAQARFHIEAGAARPGATLPYASATVNFTAGSVLTGHTSNASARIMATAPSGTAGTVTLRDITGTFIAGETITDLSGGSAQVSGPATFSDAALDDGGVTTIRAKSPATGVTYTAVLDCSGSDVRLRVTGAVSNIVEWTADVKNTQA